MTKLVAVAAVALVLCAPASAFLRASEQGIVYSPTTLPAAKVSTRYDVTMTAKYAAINGGGYASLGTQMTLTTSSEAAPGILFRVGKVPGGSSLELIGDPTAPGAFHFTTCVVFSDGSCEAKQWTLDVSGKVKATPSWVQRAKDAKLDLEQALRDESSSESLIQDFKYAKAQSVLNTAGRQLYLTKKALNLVADVLPAGSAKSDAMAAYKAVDDALSLDDEAEREAGYADDATGDTETREKEHALNDLSKAASLKDTAIAKTTSVLASAP